MGFNLSKTSMAVALAGALALTLATPIHAQDRTITVTGRGEVAAAPDMATVFVGVQTEAEVAAQALDAASAATAAVLAALDNAGVASGDIRSGAIRLNPRYGEGVLGSGPQITGYEAVNSIEVRVTDLSGLGGLLAQVVGDGANRLDGVAFGLQNPQNATDEARRRAVADAARIAALYAQAGDVTLGALMEVREGGGGGYSPMMADARVMEVMESAPQFDVPVAAGDITLNASVTMVYAILD